MRIYFDNETEELLEKYDIHNIYELEDKKHMDIQLLRLYLAITEYIS